MGWVRRRGGEGQGGRERAARGDAARAHRDHALMGTRCVHCARVCVRGVVGLCRRRRHVRGTRGSWWPRRAMGERARCTGDPPPSSLPAGRAGSLSARGPQHGQVCEDRVWSGRARPCARVRLPWACVGVGARRAGVLAWPRVPQRHRAHAGLLVLMVVHDGAQMPSRSRPRARRTHAARSCWACAGLRGGRWVRVLTSLGVGQRGWER